jgi:pimeloyl-ACP methyl ester carboxylesterase
MHTEPDSEAQKLEDPGRIAARIHHCEASPTLVYLPGVHGDWTLLAGFRRALGETVRFVELTYPRTIHWTLADYAQGVETLLDDHGIRDGWLLAESFGSQVAWELLHRGKFGVAGVILAGGFARHPAPWMARVAARLVARSSYKRLTRVFRVYAAISRIRFHRSPETLRGLVDFMARRTEQDCRAVQRRLELVALNDPRLKARATKVPLHCLTGFWDPIVPWYPARRWLQLNCSGYRGHWVIWKADHNVLGTAPLQAAAHIVNWMAKQPKRGQDMPPG